MFCRISRSYVSRLIAVKKHRKNIVVNKMRRKVNKIMLIQPLSFLAN